MADNDDLLDYEDEEQPDQTVVDGTVEGAVPKKEVKGTYVSIHSSGFRDFLLKPEILRAIVDCGFEHPSEGRPNIEKYMYMNFKPAIILLIINNDVPYCITLNST